MYTKSRSASAGTQKNAERPSPRPTEPAARARDGIERCWKAMTEAASARAGRVINATWLLLRRGSAVLTAPVIRVGIVGRRANPVTPQNAGGIKAKAEKSPIA